jgi:hypothetical protein
MENMLKSLKLWSVLLVMLTAITACEDDDTVNLPAPEARFTHTIDQETGTVTFINASENSESFNWDLGDGTSSNLISPVKTYPTGSYTVVLTAENAEGETDTYEDDLFIQVPEPINIPVDFDNDLVDYEVTVFNGASFAIVENPDASDANPVVSNVGAVTNSGNAFEGFFFDLGDPLDLSSEKSVEMKVWSTSPLPVLLKLELGTGGDVETVANHSGTGWETLYFTFDTSNSYSRMTIFVDGPGTSSGTFYLDDIDQLNTEDIPCPQTELEIPIDFDCNSIDYTAKIVGNVNFTVVDNPELSGINNVDTKVGQITNTGQEFENAFFNLDVPVDFSVDTGIRLKLFSNQALPILLKFEDGTEADVEDIQNHGGTGWEELTFTLNSAGSYNDMVLFVDGPGTAAGTFYVDDFQQVSGTPPPPPFDGGLLNNGGFDNGSASWTLGAPTGDPAPVVTEGGNTFFQIDVLAAGNPFDVNLSQVLNIVDGETYTLSFDAWTNAAGAGRTLIAGVGRSGTPDFANANTNETAGLTNPVLSTTPTRFEYTFEAVPGAADGRVLFDMGAEIGLVNIDNVRLILGDGSGGGGGGCDGEAVAATSLPVDFEGCESFISTFASSDGGLTTSLTANPDPSGINTSDNVLRVDKGAGINRWAGCQNSFPAGTIDITTNTFKIKVYSAYPNVTYRFELALDPQTEPVTGNPAPVFRQVSGGANEWVELEFTFINLPASPTTYNQLVIKPDNPDGSDGEQTAEARVYYFDDLRLD